ncbi:ethanolamine utilization protein EutN [Roseiarcus fermentans]|uniref:Ethanolamine utilization protein EutN n=1 Tax=Roseiarcus fermentans TaxID=1473586 RepID=A0A366FQR3_9HYPH|nr:EutN/CcmL family microcompartment protein [Roseiarcus fermentans]RBP16065.1 ethanolamine utilization protein EutN [Roseiarcus fermentans]
MELGRVVGTVVSTIKTAGLNSFKLLLVAPFSEPQEPNPSRFPYVAIDLAGAGEGEIVLVTTGSAARATPGSEHSPTDAAIVAVVDTVRLGDRTLFAKG